MKNFSNYLLYILKPERNLRKGLGFDPEIIFIIRFKLYFILASINSIILRSQDTRLDLLRVSTIYSQSFYLNENSQDN